MISKGNFLEKIPQNQLSDHDIRNFILKQGSYAQSKARDNNSKLESINDTFLGAKTTKSDIVDVANLIKNNYISDTDCGTNRVFSKILSSHIFLSEFLQESVFNFDHLKIILHVFENERKYFLSLPLTEQKCFLKQFLKYVHRKSTSSVCLDNNLNSEREICKLSEKRKVLLHITHILYPNKKIHFSVLLQKLNIFYNSIDCLSTFDMQLTFFEKTKKYFIIENDGLVELNLAPELKILNTEILHDCISPTNPGISINKQEGQNAVKLNEDSETIKNCFESSSIPPAIIEGNGSFKEHSAARKTSEEIIPSPSSELDRIFKLLARKEVNIQKNGDTAIPLHDSPNICDLSKKTFDRSNEVNTVSDINIDTSGKNGEVMEKKHDMITEKMNFNSSKQNSDSINDEDILRNKEDGNSCSRKKMEIASNDEIISISDLVKELEQYAYYEILGTSEELKCNLLEDRPVDYSVADEVVNACVTPKKKLPVNEKEISYLQRVPKQSPKFVKHPTQESQLSMSMERTHTHLNTSFLLSEHSEDQDFGYIKSLLFDDIAFNDYCTNIVDSILGPLKFPTSNKLEYEESKSHDVSLCLKEIIKLEKHSDFRLDISEEDRCSVKNCFQSSEVCKHSEIERKAVNFFIVILGKYCSGLSFKMLHTYLQIASKEVVQYLNDCYESNLLHFFRENEKYFYISPISRNVYLRK